MHVSGIILNTDVLCFDETSEVVECGGYPTDSAGEMQRELFFLPARLCFRIELKT